MAEPTAQRRRIDSAMLDSLSTWFRMRSHGYAEAHSFNDMDVSEMLARASSIVSPGPVSAIPKAAQQGEEG